MLFSYLHLFKDKSELVVLCCVVVFVPRILFIYISISICIYFFLLLFVLFCVLLLS